MLTPLPFDASVSNQARQTWKTDTFRQITCDDIFVWPLAMRATDQTHGQTRSPTHPRWLQACPHLTTPHPVRRREDESPSYSKAVSWPHRQSDEWLSDVPVCMFLMRLPRRCVERYDGWLASGGGTRRWADAPGEVR